MVRPTAAASFDFSDQCTQMMPPIPSKLHCIFSLRSIVSVLKGMSIMGQSEFNNDIRFIKFWSHEMSLKF